MIKLQVLRPVTLLKRDSNQVLSCEYCEIFKNSYFEKHLGTAVSEYFHDVGCKDVLF